jgi:hypothetical protein
VVVKITNPEPITNELAFAASKCVRLRVFETCNLPESDKPTKRLVVVPPLESGKMLVQMEETQNSGKDAMDEA